MSLKKNISGGELDVPLLGRIVGDGETVEVPDFQPAHDPASQPGDPGYLPIVWPPNRWQDADPPKAAKASARPADDTSGKAS
jgi:hypothetical protein